ncbi:hypothetical protein CP973_39585 [Streptomyces albofaciens JCM 4342]|uniref:hypothetical protein n=1 Tax=Streptomyces albofaciens TaxID=66866 RepID=UPI00123B0636|nr:hypothetical protein [Streptomyces albofaciens]KAA6215096.1 hypothetical protein CP973_39585 [Streptomyces albofaciens JCM 4342]
MRHRIRRFTARARELLLPSPITPFTTLRAPVRPTPTPTPIAGLAPLAGRALDLPYDGDASPLVRPYLTAFEARAHEWQVRRDARLRTMLGEFAV